MAAGKRAIVAIAIVVFSCILPTPYSVNLAGPGGPQRLRQRAVQLPNGDVNLTVDPLSLVVYRGSSQTSEVVVGSLGGFNGTVSLNPIPNFALDMGLSASVSPFRLTVLSNGKALSTLNVSATPSTPFGSYTVTMLVSGYGLDHNETVNVTVPGFRMDSFSRISTIQQGSSAFFTVTITSLLRFRDLISFGVNAYSSGAEVSVSPSTVRLASGGTNSTVVKVYIPPSLYSYREGVYAIDLIASSNGTSDDFRLSVITPGTATNLLVPFLVGGGLLVGLVAILYKRFRAKPRESL